MKNKVIVGMLIGMSTVGLLGAYTSTKELKEIKGSLVNQQNVLATLWQQESGEVKALRLQAYNQAIENIDQLIADGAMPENGAVVLDLDETVLDNIPAGAYQITSNNGYNHDDFTEWTGKAECKAIEGSVEFINYAQSKGVDVFFISNRSIEEMPQTIKNLKDLGVEVPNENILLKTGSSGKGERISVVEKTNEIVMFVGDNLGDFGQEYYKKTNEERSQLVIDNKDDMGVKFITVPNPTYGDFDGALIDYNWGATGEEKVAIKNSKLKPFK